MKLLSSLKFLIAILIIFLISQILIVTVAGPVAQDLLPLQLTFSKANFLNIIKKWPKDGIHYYTTHLYLDYLHAIIYSVLLASLLSISQKQTNTNSYKTLVLAFIPGASDWVENTIHLFAIANIHSLGNLPITISALFSWTKWLSALIILFYGSHSLIKKFTGKSN